MLAIAITSIYMWIRAGIYGHKTATEPLHIIPVVVVVSTRRLAAACNCYICATETEHYNIARRIRHEKDFDK